MLHSAYWQLPTFRDNQRYHLQGSRDLTNGGETDRLSLNVGNYQYTLRNIPEERRSELTNKFFPSSNDKENNSSRNLKEKDLSILACTNVPDRRIW